MSQLEIYHRKLPHWHLDGAIYFVTFHLHPDFEFEGKLTNEEISIIKLSLLYGHKKRWFSHCFSILPNHVHWIVTLTPSEKLTTILQEVKSYTAHALNRGRNRQGKVWVPESYDRIIRNENDYTNKCSYIFTNAVKYGLAESGEKYFGYWQHDH